MVFEFATADAIVSLRLSIVPFERTVEFLGVSTLGPSASSEFSTWKISCARMCVTRGKRWPPWRNVLDPIAEVVVQDRVSRMDTDGVHLADRDKSCSPSNTLRQFHIGWTSSD